MKKISLIAIFVLALTFILATGAFAGDYRYGDSRYSRSRSSGYACSSHYGGYRPSYNYGRHSTRYYCDNYRSGGYRYYSTRGDDCWDSPVIRFDGYGRGYRERYYPNGGVVRIYISISPGAYAWSEFGD